MARDKKIRSIKEKLDYYTMEAENEEFDARGTETAEKVGWVGTDTIAVEISG